MQAATHRQADLDSHLLRILGLSVNIPGAKNAIAHEQHCPLSVIDNFLEYKK